ncbi:MAG TPA: hypothetical protein VGR00_04265, partial [Thermoanaerobaculia bacterium]|nr:hypothetical protein [Thermoanaerobaculia bacterium]
MPIREKVRTVSRNVAVAFFPLVIAAALPALAQPIGGEFRVNTYTTGYHFSPDVAVSFSGDFVVVWQGVRSDDDYGVFGQRYGSAGTPLGGEFRINTRTTNDQNNPTVAVAGSGDFVVVFRNSFGSGMAGISGQRYSSAGSVLGGEFSVSAFTSLSQSYPLISSTPQGDFVVVWEVFAGSYPNTTTRILGRRFTSSGAALGGEFQVNTSTVEDQSVDGVSLDSSGGFVVVWSSFFGTSPNTYGHILGRRWASTGVPLGLPFRVNTYTTGAKTFTAVSVDSSGSFVVVWQSRNQGPDAVSIVGQRFASSGSPQGGEFVVGTSTAYLQAAPDVSSDSRGGFVVVWGQVQNQTDVLARRYASDGSPFEAAFRVNTYTTNSQDFPAVSTDSTGRFVVAYQSGTFGQVDIAAQRFCSPLLAVTIAVNGSSTVCPTGTGGTATVSDAYGGFTTHQWQYRPTGGMSYT